MGPFECGYHLDQELLMLLMTEMRHSVTEIR